MENIAPPFEKELEPPVKPVRQTPKKLSDAKTKVKTDSDLEGNNTVRWVTKNTAIIVVHGIGNQLPLQTLDSFGRGLVEQYGLQFSQNITIQHCLMNRGSDDNPWFENVVRIRKTGSEHHIDLYEYYWANFTEDKASWVDIKEWLDGVVKGARKFYNEQPAFANAYGDSSIFFNKKGEFRPWVYRVFIGFTSKFIVAYNLIIDSIYKLASYIPVFGGIISAVAKALISNAGSKFANVVGDICVYNVVDPKSKFYQVRREILDGAVSSIRYLLEKQNAHQSQAYPAVIVAGHSLGSQIAYDAINKINLLAAQGIIKGYDVNGISRNSSPRNKPISSQLCGFITFGSPLDKIVFFLRERTEAQETIRRQLLESYHCFKQLQWSTEHESHSYFKMQSGIIRLLDNILWKNYYDNRDYVSGRLDYYGNVENVNCEFKSDFFSFTHSHYWTDPRMYQDIITNFLT